tara:strand:+ start:881 stop:1252 length:372 start_codon:yes stop_codon:yes gene_type:complete
MATIDRRIIGIPESQRNFKALEQRPRFGIHTISTKRYQNNKIFEMKPNTPSINSRIGMSQNNNLIARPCESVNERSNNRQSGGFRVNHFDVKAGNGLSKRFFTNDRLGFTADLKQKPLINKIY